jgi:ribulose-phosphate 3-epimerase
VVKAVRKATSLPVDVHLMIMDPDKYIADFANAGADYLTVHAEVLPHLNRTLSEIRNHGVKAGVAINPSTSLSTLDWVWEYMDMLLIMSVNPGFGGQSFIPNCLDKISGARIEIDMRGVEVLLEVDGGIKVDNAREVAEAGADILVAGSAVFGTDDYKKTVKAFKKATNIKR